MGVYDFFKGLCPACEKDVDDHPDYGKGGDIQTKLFDPTPDEDNCFREFYPGTHVPFAPKKNEIMIGRTACCRRLIKACFQGTLLIGYKLVLEGETDSFLP